MQITVHYRAFGDEFDVPVATPDCFRADDITVLRALFENTNLYTGPFWDRIEPLLPSARNHTALSVGDFVTVGRKTYRCDRFGWEHIGYVGHA